MRTSEEILRYLKCNGVKTVFGVPSGTISPMVDSFNDVSDMEYIITQHEGAASYSACKAAKVSQELGVLLVSGSVGTGNAVNGIAEATQSEAPMLIIGGYVRREQQGVGAIQELEGHLIVENIVKRAIVINDSTNAIRDIKEAITIATTHPKGAVFVGIPLDVQQEEYTGSIYEAVHNSPSVIEVNGITEAKELIKNSNSGLIIVGSACRGLGDVIKTLAGKLNWRLVTTPSAKGVIEEEFPLHLGSYGFPGSDMAIKYIENEHYDCVLALGTSLGECSTQNFNKKLVKDKLIHVSINPKDFNKVYKADITIQGEIEEVLLLLTAGIEDKKEACNVFASLNNDYIRRENDLISLRAIAEGITDILPKDTFYLNDIGSSKIFTLKYMRVPAEGDFEVNVNYACMGSSVGAMGISRLYPNRKIAVFIGDGSFFMSGLSELITAKKYNMNIVYFVINNNGLAFVDKGHQSIFGRTYEGFNNSNIPISGITEQMGILSFKLTKNCDIQQLYLINEASGPVIVEVEVDPSEIIPTNRFKDLSAK